MTKPAKTATEPPKDMSQDWANLKDLILRLLPPMASLAAVSLAGVSLFQLLDKLNAADTILDEMLAFCAVLLLLCYPVTIWAVRTKHVGRAFFSGANDADNVFVSCNAAGVRGFPRAVGPVKVGQRDSQALSGRVTTKPRPMRRVNEAFSLLH